MKKLLLIILISTAGTYVQAQNRGMDQPKWQGGIGVQAALPAFNMEINTFGTGINFEVVRRLSIRVALTGDAGFTIFFAKKEFVPTGLIPVRVGVEYLLTPTLYLSGKAGLGIYMLYTPDETVTKNFAGIEIGPGFKLGKKTELSLTYNGYQNKDGSFGFISARLRYFFIR